MEILLKKGPRAVRRGVFFMWKLSKMNRRQRNVLGGIALVFVLAVAFRGITERAFLAQASIEGAFSLLNPKESTGTVTITGRYLPPPYGFSEEKLLKHFGEQIGLTVDGEIRCVDFEGRRELVYEKTAAEAHSVLKLVCLTEGEAYYLCAEISLSDKNALQVSWLRKELLQSAEETGLTEVSVTLELCGMFDGEIPLAEKDALTDRLLSELYAQPVYENRQNNYYTVYAYTGAVEDYITVERNKINVQVLIDYNPNKDCTEVVLASPLGLR